MRIGIDARPLISKELTGIGVVVYHIVEYLNIHDKVNEYFLYSHLPLESISQLNDNFHIQLVKGVGKIGTFKCMFGMPKLIKRDQLDVYWGTEHYLPQRVAGVRYVLTIHDLALLINPAWGSRMNGIIQRCFTPGSIRRADMVMADSEATRQDVLRICKKNAEQVKVVYVGFSPQGNNISESKQLSEDPEQFFLFLGTLEPRKNVSTLIKAFEKLAGEYQELHLVIAGGLGWKYEPVLNVIETSPYKERIIRTGYVRNERKYELLRKATALIFPSHYEGFGIPVLEGMSTGTVVITSENSSLTEVGGDAAFYVKNENDAGELADVMRGVLSMDSNMRNERVRMGMEQCEKFSWERYAEEVNKIIEGEEYGRN